MATTAEFTGLINLFVEALDRLQADKSEVTAAQEALLAAQTALAKEEADVTGATTSLTDIWGSVKLKGDELVAQLVS
jgi:hypothetical protein